MIRSLARTRATLPSTRACSSIRCFFWRACSMIRTLSCNFSFSSFNLEICASALSRLSSYWPCRLLKLTVSTVSIISSSSFSFSTS